MSASCVNTSRSDASQARRVGRTARSGAARPVGERQILSSFQLSPLCLTGAGIRRRDVAIWKVRLGAIYGFTAGMEHAVMSAKAIIRSPEKRHYFANCFRTRSVQVNFTSVKSYVSLSV